MKRKKLLKKARKLRSTARASEIERNLYIRVDRSAGSGDPVVDYLRLGSPADDVSYDDHVSIEDHAVDLMTADETLDPAHETLGAAGEFSYTPGSRTRYVGGDDYQRVAGDVYRTYGSYHETIVSADKSSTNKISGTKQLTVFDQGIGTYYEIKYGGSYYYKGDLSCIYEDNLKYECKIAGALTSSLAVTFALSQGLSLSDMKAKFSAFGYEAQVDGTGNFKSSKSLTVSQKIQQLAKDKIVLSLSDTISQIAWEKGIWKTLLALAQVTNGVYVAANIASSLNSKDYEDKPGKLSAYLTTMQTAAMVQGAIALIFAAAALVHDNWYGSQVDDIKKQVGAVGYGKPFVQIKDNMIELNSGDGASIVLDGKYIYLNADGIELSTGASTSSVKDGIAAYTNNGPISLNADHCSGAALTSAQGTTIVGGTDLNLTAYNGGKIDSKASTWTHGGEFAAGNTTVGDLTATSVTANGVPVVPTPPVVMVAVAPIPVVSINLYINVIDPSSLLSMISAL